MRTEIEPQHFFQFTEAAIRWNIFTLLEEILQDPNSASHKELIVWLLQQYKKIRPDSETPEAEAVGEEDETVCPFKYLC